MRNDLMVVFEPDPEFCPGKDLFDDTAKRNNIVLFCHECGEIYWQDYTECPNIRQVAYLGTVYRCGQMTKQGVYAYPSTSSLFARLYTYFLRTSYARYRCFSRGKRDCGMFPDRRIPPILSKNRPKLNKLFKNGPFGVWYLHPQSPYVYSISSFMLYAAWHRPTH